MHVCFKLQLKLLGLDLSFKLFAYVSPYSEVSKHLTILHVIVIYYYNVFFLSNLLRSIKYLHGLRHLNLLHE